MTNENKPPIFSLPVDDIKFLESDTDDNGVTLSDFINNKTIKIGGFITVNENDPALLLVFTDGTTIIALVHNNDLIVMNGHERAGTSH